MRSEDSPPTEDESNSKKVVIPNTNPFKIKHIILKKFVMPLELEKAAKFCYTFAA